MSVGYKHPRGTKADLQTLANSSALSTGQIYQLTDEDRIAIATSTSGFETFLKESEAGGGGPQKRHIQATARWYFYADRRWVSGSDDNYGPLYVNNNESAGTGIDPIREWETQGFYLKAGTVIKTVTIIGRANNNDITDIEMYWRFRRPDPITRWDNGTGNGIDNDAEQVHDIVHRDFWKTTLGTGPLGTAAGPVSTVAMNDQHRRIIEVDYTCPTDGWFDMLMKPVGTNTATRYFYCTHLIECEI